MSVFHCDECDGNGTIGIAPSFRNIHNGTSAIEGGEVECEACEGTGFTPCECCGESLATFRVEADFGGRVLVSWMCRSCMMGHQGDLTITHINVQFSQAVQDALPKMAEAV